MKTFMEKIGKFAPVPIARRLSEGDEIGNGFVVLDTPGHSPGHVSFWREADRVLICGDVWFNLNVLTLRPGLRPPLKAPTVNPPLNARSQQRLVDLEPDIVGFGHGPVMTGAAAKLRVFPA
jgi:glyoxylase-like metal-dependent hydrolase (beta-lactamase superfamily II)